MRYITSSKQALSRKNCVKVYWSLHEKNVIVPTVVIDKNKEKQRKRIFNTNEDVKRFIFTWDRREDIEGDTVEISTTVSIVLWKYTVNIPLKNRAYHYKSNSWLTFEVVTDWSKYVCIVYNLHIVQFFEIEFRLASFQYFDYACKR